MTTEEDFQRILDTNIKGHHTRLIFADWLDERNDPRAEGYRALGTICHYPMRTHRWITPDKSDTGDWKRVNGWGWSSTDTGTPKLAMLRSLWYECILKVEKPNPFLMWDTRREAEDVAALAFILIPEKHRYRCFK